MFKAFVCLTNCLLTNWEVQGIAIDQLGMCKYCSRLDQMSIDQLGMCNWGMGMGLVGLANQQMTNQGSVNSNSSILIAGLANSYLHGYSDRQTDIYVLFQPA